MKKINALILVALMSIVSCTKKETGIVPVAPPSSISGMTLSGTISKDLVLVNSAADIDYILIGRLTVEAKLTVEPGVVVVTKPGTGIEVNGSVGSIKAIGSAVLPIVFRSETNSKGGWMGIRFTDSNNPLNELAYVTVSDGGSASFNGDDTEKANIRLAATCQIKMRNCTVNNSAGYGILETKYDNATIAEFTSNHFSNNSNFPIYITDKNIAKLGTTSTFKDNTKNYIAMTAKATGLTGDVIWYKQNVPYLYNDVEGLTLGYYNTHGGLTLEAGVTLLMSVGSRIFVGDNTNTTGYLKINGTAAAPVTISGLESVKGYWQNITISTPNVKNNWFYANISDAGSTQPFSLGSKANVIVNDGYYNSGRLTISNCTSNNSLGCGYSSSKLTTTAKMITGSQIGVNNTSGNSCTYE